MCLAAELRRLGQLFSFVMYIETFGPLILVKNLKDDLYTMYLYPVFKRFSYNQLVA